MVTNLRKPVVAKNEFIKHGWQILQSDIQFGEQIGKGQFGGMYVCVMCVCMCSTLWYCLALFIESINQSGFLYRRLRSPTLPSFKVAAGFILPAATVFVQPPVHCSTVGSRAFSVAGPQVWNFLPLEVTSAPSVATFCTQF